MLVVLQTEIWGREERSLAKGTLALVLLFTCSSKIKFQEMVPLFKKHFRVTWHCTTEASFP